ncbi:MAG: alpha-ribazole phosphatase [Anaerolineae bacterium]
MEAHETGPDTWVYLIRHGETDWNAQGRWMGHSIAALNDTGQAQARRVAARLAGAGLAALYASDTVRTLQTARAIAEATGLEIRPDPRLREMDVGVWQGHTRAEIETNDPARYAARQRDPLNMPIPGGESWLDLVARVREAFDAITAAHRGACVAIVAHGGPIKAILYLLDGAPQTLLEPQVTNASITLLRGQPGAWTVAAFNDTGHLESLA